MSEVAQNPSSSEVMVKPEAVDDKTPLSDNMEESDSLLKVESRDENDSIAREEKPGERESSVPEKKDQPTKRPQARPSPRKNKNSAPSHNSHPSPQRPYMHENYPPSYPPHNRGPYPPPHAMHTGPRGHAPGPYPPAGPGPYYGGGPHDHYRGGPPPTHYHQMPPLPHPGQYPPNGHYGHPPNMSGRPGPPPGYHIPPYGMQSYPPGPPQQPMGYHAGPPPHAQSYGHQINPSNSMSVASDNNSIASSKSKGSHISRSTKSSHGGSKKRTIEGVHTTKDKTHMYSFRRTNSNESSNTTVTAGNGTDMHPLKQDSPRKRERSSSRSSHHLPYTTSENIFDQERFHHRRAPSGSSTASSLSVGGFSLHSYEGPRSKFPFLSLRQRPLAQSGTFANSFFILQLIPLSTISTR